MLGKRYFLWIPKPNQSVFDNFARKVTGNVKIYKTFIFRQLCGHWRNFSKKLQKSLQKRLLDKRFSRC